MNFGDAHRLRRARPQTRTRCLHSLVSHLARAHPRPVRDPLSHPLESRPTDVSGKRRDDDDDADDDADDDDDDETAMDDANWNEDAAPERGCERKTNEKSHDGAGE